MLMLGHRPRITLALEDGNAKKCREISDAMRHAFELGGGSSTSPSLAYMTDTRDLLRLGAESSREVHQAILLRMHGTSQLYHGVDSGRQDCIGFTPLRQQICPEMPKIEA